MSTFEVLLVTDPRWPAPRIVEVTRAAGEALGPQLAVQVRDRSAPPRELAVRLRELTRATGSALYVNHWLDLAREVEADGVHAPAGLRVPVPSPPDPEPDPNAPFDERVGEYAVFEDALLELTMPAHDPVELARAVAQGAAAVLVSPIFATPGKGPPRGLEAIRAAREIAPPYVRIVALGGIDVENAGSCREAGADAVAVMRALLDAPRPAEAALRLCGWSVQ